MSLWFELTYFLLFSSCRGFYFNVTRVIHGDHRDSFTNLDPLGKCPRRDDSGRERCLDRSGDCGNQGCCICSCTYSHSTFRMDGSLKTATCVENSAFRTFAGCSQTFATILTSQPLLTFDLGVQGSKGMMSTLPDKCKIKSAQYLEQHSWKDLNSSEKDSFYIRRVANWPYTNLMWTGKLPTLYSGYVMKISGECGVGSLWKRIQFCVLFKTKGTKSWSFPDPTTRAPPVTTAMSTTTRSLTTTAIAMRKTTQIKTKTEVVLSTETAVKSTPTAKAPSTNQDTTKAVSAKPSQETPQVTESSTKSAEITNPSRTEPASGDTITITPSNDYNPGSRKPNKGEKELNNKENGHNVTMIAAIAGVASVGCVVFALLCLWFIKAQRRKSRDLANYDAGTTVIANPTTGSQNHFPLPGLLKNPTSDDSTYMEPVERTRKNAARCTGASTSYDTDEELHVKKKLEAKDSPPLNNIRMKPLNTSNQRIHRENSYDNREQFTRGRRDGEEPIYDNPECAINDEKPVYQSLTKNDARARLNSDSNVAVYQSLNPNGMMYQSLQKNTVYKWHDDIPEYLVLLNPNESPRNISHSPPEFQPPYSTGPPPEDADESPEYADYADLDELEEIEAKEGSKKCPLKGPSYAALMYNVLEGPSCDYACSAAGVVYDVLEGPDSESNGITNQSFEPPMYAVLEGPDKSS